MNNCARYKRLLSKIINWWLLTPSALSLAGSTKKNKKKKSLDLGVSYRYYIDRRVANDISCNAAKFPKFQESLTAREDEFSVRRLPTHILWIDQWSIIWNSCQGTSFAHPWFLRREAPLLFHQNLALSFLLQNYRTLWSLCFGCYAALSYG